MSSTSPTRRPGPAARLSFLAVALVMVVTACGSTGTDDDPTGRTWALTELDGAAPVDGTTIDMTITGDAVAGSAGCNTYGGSVTVDDGSMTFGADIVSTMMACEEPIMNQELKYLDMLTQVTSYEMAADELLLKDAQGVVLATFE